MVVLRVLAMTCCATLVAYPVGRAMLIGLRSGRLPHSDSTSIIARGTHPVRYWALMGLYAAILAIVCLGTARALQRMLA